MKRRIMMCKEEKIDLPLQETLRCDRLLRNTSKKEFSEVHVITRVMLCGNVRAAVRWLSEKSDGVLHHMVDISGCNRNGSTTSVLHSLRLKHQTVSFH